MSDKPEIPEGYEECGFEEATHVFALRDEAYGSPLMRGDLAVITGHDEDGDPLVESGDYFYRTSYALGQEFVFVKPATEETPTALPTDAQERKGIPIYSGFVKYFPDAMAAVAQLSFIGNEQHHPGTPLHWDKSKSQDELDALMRHTVDNAKGTLRDTEGVLHAVKTAWRAMANLQRLADSGVNIFAEGR